MSTALKIDLPGSTGRPGWITRNDPTPTTDVTRRFLELIGLATHGHAVLPQDAAAPGYLVIGGLFGKHMPGYMEANLEALKEHDLEARLVPVDSDASVKRNAQTVRRAIEASSAEGRRLVLIGHSKGGVDAAAALSMHPELKTRVRALVAIQSPFGGSPIAQDLESTPVLGRAVNRLVRNVLRGDPRSVKDLTYDARERFLLEHPLPLDVPTLCIATSRLDVTSALVASQDYLRARYGFPSDGLVVPDDAVVPGAQVVRLNDMDHAESALAGLPGFARYTPRAVTLAAVALALEASRGRDTQR